MRNKSQRLVFILISPRIGLVPLVVFDDIRERKYSKDHAETVWHYTGCMVEHCPLGGLRPILRHRTTGIGQKRKPV